MIQDFYNIEGRVNENTRKDRIYETKSTHNTRRNTSLGVPR